MKPLRLLLQRFADAGLEFVVVGGFADVLHGSSYGTDDLDICAVLSGENVEKLRTALADLHPVHRITHKKLSFLEHPPAGQPVANLYLETDAGVVDVLSSILAWAIRGFATERAGDSLVWPSLPGDFIGGPDQGQGGDGPGEGSADGEGAAGDCGEKRTPAGSRA